MKNDHDLLLCIDGKLDGVNRRLDTLNSSVAKHESGIEKNKTTARDNCHNLDTLMDDRKTRQEDSRRLKLFTVERIIQLATVLLLAYVGLKV